MNNSGQQPGPENPREKSVPPGTSARDDQDEDWTTWRQGAGYSQPVPPEPPPVPPEPPPARPEPDPGPEAGAFRPEPGKTDRVWTSRRSPAAQRAYQGPGSGAEAGPHSPPAPYEPGSYRTPGAHQEFTHGGPGRYGGSWEQGDARRVWEPEGYDEPAGYDEPVGHRPDDIDSGAEREDSGTGRRFAEPGGGRSGPPPPSPAGAFAPPPSAGSPAPPPSAGSPAPPPSAGSLAPPPPDMPADTSIYRSPASRRQLAFLGTAVAVVVAAGIVAAVLLLSHHGPARHPAAGGHPSPSARSHSARPSTPASPPPPLIRASGHLGVPAVIGSLRLNRALTRKFVGPAVLRQDARSFLIPHSDVVSGFYTSNPAATTFTAKDQRIMFLAAYLAGGGNAKSALHDFLTNHTFTGRHRVSAGPQGGVAACGLLPQQPAPVAHCMWADGNSYVDFYAWNRSPSALAKTMIAIRPQIERTSH